MKLLLLFMSFCVYGSQPPAQSSYTKLEDEYTALIKKVRKDLSTDYNAIRHPEQTVKDAIIDYVVKVAVEEAKKAALAETQKILNELNL